MSACLAEKAVAFRSSSETNASVDTHALLSNGMRSPTEVSRMKVDLSRLRLRAYSCAIGTVWDIEFCWTTQLREMRAHRASRNCVGSDIARKSATVSVSPVNEMALQPVC